MTAPLPWDDPAVRAEVMTLVGQVRTWEGDIRPLLAELEWRSPPEMARLVVGLAAAVDDQRTIKQLYSWTEVPTRLCPLGHPMPVRDGRSPWRDPLRCPTCMAQAQQQGQLPPNLRAILNAHRRNDMVRMSITSLTRCGVRRAVVREVLAELRSYGVLEPALSREGTSQGYLIREKWLEGE